MTGQADSHLSPSGGGLSPQAAAEMAWLADIYSHGVSIKGDSVYFNDETRRIATDSVYRSIIYPEEYTWDPVPALLNVKAVKPALWYMINLLHRDTSHLPLILKMILPMDQVMEMDRVLVATYYTYIAFDPEVYEMVNGKSVKVNRPDIAEQKLLAAKVLVEQIFAHRARQQPDRE